VNKSNYDVVILGHFAKDILVINGAEKEALGGAVYYGAMALSNLNYSTAIITLLSKDDFSYLEVLRSDGIDVYPYEADVTSGIKNTYFGENHDKRICEPIAFAGEFKTEHIPEIKTKVFHIGPIMAGEVSLNLIEQITSQFDRVSLDLQGVLRVRDGKNLIFVDWPDKERGLRNIHTVKADSVEAEVITGEKEIIKAARIIAEWGPGEVVITHKDGLMVYAEGKVYEALFTPQSINGRTGRGDTAMVSYLASRLKASPGESCTFAAAVTSMKLEKEGPFDRNYQEVIARIDNDYPSGEKM